MFHVERFLIKIFLNEIIIIPISKKNPLEKTNVWKNQQAQFHFPRNNLFNSLNIHAKKKKEKRKYEKRAK